MSDVGKRKLGPAQVCRIRVLRAKGYRLSVLGEIFGLHKSTVSRICRRIYWEGVE